MNKKTIMKRNKDRAFGIRRLAGKYLELDSFGPDTGYRISPLISREDDQLTEGYGFYIDFYHGKWSEGSMDSPVCVSVGRDLSGADMVCISAEPFGVVMIPVSEGFGAVIYSIGEAVMACRTCLRSAA